VVSSIVGTTVARRRAGWASLVLAAFGVACERAESTALPLQGVPLVDQSGAQVSAKDLANRPLLVSFMFTSCPAVCPRQTESLVAVRAALPEPVRERVRFLSISVDPENDSPEALRQFAHAHGAAQPGWSFVRSDATGTQELTRRFAAFEPGKPATPSAHNTVVYLFDRGGRLVQRYRGAPLDVPHLARELALLDESNPPGARLAAN
jgi:protein SCO1